MPYEEQLRLKQKRVEGLLGGFCRVLPIRGMNNPWNARCKVHRVFGWSKGTGIMAGIYTEGTHRIVNVEKCLIEDEKSQAIIETVKKLAGSFKYKIYDEDTGFGLLRHIVVRRGANTGEIMLVLVMTSPVMPGKSNFVKALLKEHPDITTIILNVNHRKTTMVMGRQSRRIYGPGFIRDRLCGCTFRISPDSFYQVNPKQAEILYNTAIEFAALSGNETVIDAYCGTGTIGLAAAGGAKKLIGIELNKNAVADARINGKENNIRNATFAEGDAGEYLMAAASKGERADVIIMDPPRSGSTETFMKAAVKIKPSRIVYVSCGLESLARDLKWFTHHGYRVEKIQPVDMFPMTEHVETVCLLGKREPDAKVKIGIDMDDYYRIREMLKANKPLQN